eukprot:4786919-Prymnesium_polylepis.1
MPCCHIGAITAHSIDPFFAVCTPHTQPPATDDRWNRWSLLMSSWNEAPAASARRNSQLCE